MSDSATKDHITRRSLELIPRLNRWAQSAILQERMTKVDLSLRQLSALFVIQEGSITPGHLAKRLMVTPAVVTGLIDRLERRGFVRRISETGDRRRIQLELTEAGREAGRIVTDDLVRHFSGSLNSISADDLITLDRGLDLLYSVMDDLESRGFHEVKD